jgi:hypothetical protein
MVNITETALGAGFTSEYFNVSVGFLPDTSPNSYGRPLPSVFALYARYLPQNYTQIEVNSTSAIKGLIQKTCLLYGGTVVYDIVLQNGSIETRYDDYLKDDFVQDQ